LQVDPIGAMYIVIDILTLSDSLVYGKHSPYPTSLKLKVE